MLTAEKRKEHNEIADVQRQIAVAMREKTARYFDYLTNGSTDVEFPIPSSDLRQISVSAKTAEGVPVQVTVWQAKFGDETIQRVERSDARQWIRCKRQLWDSGEAVLRERAIAKAKVIRALDRLCRVAEEISDFVSDDTMNLLNEAAAKVDAAIDSIE